MLSRYENQTRVWQKTFTMMDKNAALDWGRDEICLILKVQKEKR